MQPCTASLICPICSQPLHAADRSLRCSRGHTFDRAREGYVDLLPSGHGLSRIRGDTAEMLRARRRFLQRGHYEPLSRAVNDSCARHLSRLGTAGRSYRKRTVVEVGCGEGYYLGRARQAATRAAWGANACFYGLDVSKHAVRLAAGVYKRSHSLSTAALGGDATHAVTHAATHEIKDLHARTEFLRNDVNHLLCFADHSVDILLDIFAPRNPDEFERVLHPEGLLIVVIPSENHLKELRSALPLLGLDRTS